MKVCDVIVVILLAIHFLMQMVVFNPLTLQRK
jgi:hypothetical protein